VSCRKSHSGIREEGLHQGGTEQLQGPNMPVLLQQQSRASQHTEAGLLLLCWLLAWTGI